MNREEVGETKDGRSARILLVDDDKLLLDLLTLQFRKEFSIIIAESAEVGLEKLRRHGPFEVVVTDMKMPGMDGIQFLTKVKEIHPEAVRVMMTGNTDLQTAIDSVNSGQIFRFLLKPCKKETIEAVLCASIEQYRLVTSERELLELTLKGSIQVLTDLLSLESPIVYGRASRLREYVAQIVANLGITKSWQYELAALFSQIGQIHAAQSQTAADDSLVNISADLEFTSDPRPELAVKLLSMIPRLELVRSIIAKQHLNRCDIALSDEEILQHHDFLGAQLLRTGTDFDRLVISGESVGQSLALMKSREGVYLPLILQSLEKLQVQRTETTPEDMPLDGLDENMVLDEDVFTRSGLLIAPRGQRVTLPLRVRLKDYWRNFEKSRTVKVRIVNKAWDSGHLPQSERARPVISTTTDL